jgi:hypothetical protein
MNIYFVAAMKRSGHHAIVNWICKQHGNIRHINNAVEGWEKNSFKEPTHSAGKTTTYGEGRDLLISIEDFDIEDWDTWTMWNFKEFEEASNIYRIIINRDYKNWLASCYTRFFQTNHDWQDVARALAVEYKNDRGDIKEPRMVLWGKLMYQSLWEGSAFMSINYNDWVTNEDYRAFLASRLSIPFTDEGKYDVSKFGGGSSFEGQDLDTRSIDVLTRWQRFADDDIFNDYLNLYPKNIELSNEYFVNKKWMVRDYSLLEEPREPTSVFGEPEEE